MAKLPGISRTSGNPPTPLEVRRRTGNPSKRPMPDPSTLTMLPGAAEPPEPMRPLGRAGRELWDRVWMAGAVWLARDIDSETLLITCEQMDERQQLRGKVLNQDDWRARQGLRALDAQILGGLGAMGFNPTDRARLAVAEVVQSPLDNFMARRQQRSSS